MADLASRTVITEFPFALYSTLLRYLSQIKGAEPQDHLIKLCERKEDDLDMQCVKGHFSSTLNTALGMIMRGFTCNPGSYSACQSSHQNV